MKRITPDKILMLQPNEIFVFGSNQAGRHGKGAAKIALDFGAKYGEGAGHFGNTYAIPTKDYNLQTLRLDWIEQIVQIFILYAIKNPNLKFFVTEIGCGLAGYKHKDIAPFFAAAKNIDNIYLPLKFWNEL